jgi:hypothetical protein
VGVGIEVDEGNGVTVDVEVEIAIRVAVAVGGRVGLDGGCRGERSAALVVDRGAVAMAGLPGVHPPVVPMIRQINRASARP